MSGLRIFLTGFSGSGKTAVGRRVARLLGWDFVDTDEHIVERAGQPIEAIFASDGEVAFRRLEFDVVCKMAGRDRVVVATGGGAIVQNETRAVMLGAGFVVAVEARPETIYSRLSAPAVTGFGDGAGAEEMVRPLLRSEEGQDPLERIEALKRERQWAYASAHWSVPTDGLSVEQAAHEVARAWHRFGVSQAHPGDSLVAATVVAGDGSYPIVVGWGILEAELGARLAVTGFEGRAYLVCDANVLAPYGRAVQRSLHQAGIEAHLFVFPPGEASKSLETAAKVYEWLAERRVERSDAIVAVGGGVAGDLAGFVAATYLRGIRVVQVPTTLTAMVDSSIGGKTAVDLVAAKNLVGAFHQPSLVVADVSALTTLPERELREGWAEALKHGLALDERLVDIYEAQADKLLALEPELTTEVIARNAKIKAHVVTQDERETGGLRTLLNYGHTIGHGIEAAAGYGRYLHGEAVAVGMIGAAAIGVAEGVTPTETADRQRALIERYGLPTSITGAGVDTDAVREAMSRDKKTSAGQLSWVLLDAVGHALLRRDVSAAHVHAAIEALAR